MAVTARAITVSVEGSSTSLQEATAKAANSLKLLGEETARQSQLAVDWGDRVVKSNSLVADSYGRLAEAARLGAGGIVSSTDTSLAAQGRLAESTTATTDTIVSAAERQAEAARAAAASQAESYATLIDAARASADMQGRASTTVVEAATAQADALKKTAAVADDAYGSTADAAAVSAKAQRDAADANVDSAARSGAAARDSATKQDSAAALSGSALSKLGEATTLGALGVAAGSLYMAAKFEASTTRLLTQAGATEKQLGQMRKGILDMAGEVGQSPEHLSESLYHVVSSMNAILPAAHRTTEELAIQKIAAEGAAVGHTNLEETTYALASAMNALGVRAGAAEKTMGTLNAIVGSGDMTMGDLLAALKSGLIPAAQTFGVSLESMGSALATMGDEGMRGAQAGTRLRMSLALLAAPSGKAAEYLQALGMSGAEVKARTDAMTEALDKAGLKTTTLGEDLRKPDGLAVAFKDLKDHLEASGLSATQASEVISKAFGGGRSSAAIELMVNSVGRLESKYTQIQRTTAAFGKDWEERQKNAGLQAEQLEGTLESLGVRIGTDLLPDAKELVGTLRETVEWFERGSGGARALEYAIGGVLAAGIVTYGVGSMAKFANSIKNVYGEYGKLQGYLRSGFGATPGTPGTVAVAQASTPTAGVVGAAEQATGRITGALGAGIGSGVNPMIVAIEDGQYAGLGGRAAAIGSGSVTAGENAAAEAEGKTPGGVILPRGVSAAENTPVTPVYAGARSAPEAVSAAESAVPAAEETAVTGGILASVRTGLGGVLADAMKGGMIAGLGAVAAQVAGSVVGGKTGSTISHLGTEAAIGAGVGTVVLGPGVGTAVGAALVPAVAEGLHLLEGSTEGHTIASVAAKGMGSAAEGSMQSVIDKANKVAEEARYKDEHPRAGVGDEIAHFLHEVTGLPFTTNSSTTQLTKGQHEDIERQKNAELFKGGQASGKTMFGQEVNATADMSGVDQITAIIQDTEKRIADLKPAMQKGAFESIVAMTQEFQKDGKLPPTAVEEVIHTIEGKFPALKRAFTETGGDSINALNSALKGQNVLGSIEGVVNQYTNVFRNIPQVVGLNMENAVHTFQRVNAELLREAHTGPESQRDAASAAYKKMTAEEVNYFHTMGSGITAEIASLSSHTITGLNSLGQHVTALAPGILAPLETAYKRYVKVTEEEMAAGVLPVEKGVARINKVLTSELSALGIKAPSKLNQSFGPMPGGGSNALQETGTGGSSGFTGLPHAQGGILQLGRPGEAGRDSIPMNVGGVPIVTAPGETVAVFTRHQRAAADAALPGGLAGVFANKRPNYMAEGGFVAEPGTNFTYGYEPQIVGDLRKLAAEMRETVYGISGYRSPAHSVAVGGFSNDPHTEGKAADIGLGSPTLASMMGLPEADLRKVGLYRPFYPPDSAEANHVQLIGVPYGSGSGASAGTPASGGAVDVAQQAKEILAPKAGGSGVIQQIAQAALNQVAKAANERLGSATGAGGGLASAGGTYTRSMLERLWDSAGGPASDAHLMGAIALAESAGNPNAHNASGATGLWQILGSIIPGNLDNPMVNARNAVAKFKSQGLGAWETYTSGAYRKYMAEGGIVGAAHADEGLLEDSAKGFSKNTRIFAEKKTTPKVNKGPKVTPKNHGKGPKAQNLQSLVSKIGKIPDTENVRRLAAFQPVLDALENERTLLSKIQGEPDRMFVMPGDMAELQPTLAPGENIGPWTTTTAALRETQEAVSRHGESAQLTLQKELLNYYAELPSHHLLTPADVGVLQSAGIKDPTIKPYGSIYAPIESTMAWQVNKEEDLASHEESEVQRWKELSRGYAKRQAQILHHAKMEYRRLTNIKAQIQRITTGSLEEKVKAAEDKTYLQGLKSDASASKTAIEENIAGERSLTTADQNKKLIAEWEQEKLRIEQYESKLTTPVSGTPAARVALQKNTLTNEERPLKENLHELTGSSTDVGTTGDYGKLGGYVKTLNEGVTKVWDEATSARGGLIPGLKIELETQRTEDQDAGLKPAPTITPTSGEPNSALVAALEEELKIRSTNLAVSQAQFGVFANFAARIPHYEQGGPVIEDGLIYAHKGEHVVPREGQLVAGGNGGQTTVNTTHVIQGSIAPLIELIDSRVTHPKNVRLVSRQMAQRTEANPRYRRV
jgi:TP901 family phage tail tape measure protein